MLRGGGAAEYIATGGQPLIGGKWHSDLSERLPAAFCRVLCGYVCHCSDLKPEREKYWFFSSQVGLS